MKNPNEVVRLNLMNEEGYSPYCGASNCSKGMPRSTWDKSKNQFTCKCGWVSEFPKTFIEKYMRRWNIPDITFYLTHP